ncbi:putative alpha-1,6-mannosyltransferase MNN11 [Lachancea thermotolerans]|uniref:KLTH0F04202p n=1 Tax=Lachancea thermotolerans (strain ATCC 56472 / CBS 6340 / NRRL Y-8284) TaxID=559295 RepID=C5DKF3_LACTC|nr:KLTH0F04202p [Lachancea thermotolerans CBS 6340]CAR23954.1 KLTH0F04202p [Lachancea thermotolerans CBS 6340]
MALKPKLKPMSTSNSLQKRSMQFKNVFVDSKKRRKQAFTLSVFVGIALVLYLVSGLFGRGRPTVNKYPPVHGHYINEIATTKPLIFPAVENAAQLKEMNMRSLHILRIDMDGNKKYVLKETDQPITEKERKQMTDPHEIIKRDYLDHGKLVFRKGTDSPEVVIVTLVDFDNYDPQTLIKVVQNRVNYAQRHRYGVYVRWAQEFIPLLEKQNLKESYEYLKPMIMRAAFHAFPRAKYFWFLDQDALIMRMDLSLQNHLLDPKILQLAILKNVPVVKDSNIKTYNHFLPGNAEIIFPQTNGGYLDSSSFIAASGMYSKAMFDYLSDPLVRDFPWQNFAHCVSHALQWHPSILAKTALIVPKTIASVYDPAKKADEKPGVDAFHYTAGDLVASFYGCKDRGSCIKDIDTFYDKVQTS